MSPLLSDLQMAAISDLANKGMTTTAKVYRRSAVTPAAADDYGDEVEYTETTASLAGTVQGWLRTVPTQEQDVDSGAIVTTNAWVFRVPVGTDVLTGDELVIAGSTYTVQGLNTDNTLLPYITCELRRRE